MGIVEDLKNPAYTLAEKISLKAADLSKVGNVPKFKRGNFYVEIQSITTTDVGVELLIRAWDKSNNQLAFGDGTVEIERVRLAFNESRSYLLIPNAGGIYEETFLDEDNQPFVVKYSLNPREAILRRFDTVLPTITQLATNMIVGKVGNTVTLIDNTTANTNQVNQDNVASPYSNAHDAATGTVLALNASGTQNYLHSSLITNFYVRRAQVVFNTSVIGAGQVVSAATMTMFSSASGGSDTDNYSLVMLDDTNNVALNNPLVSEDFNDFGTTSIGSIDLTAITNQNVNVAITFTDFNAITVTGNTMIGLRLSGDINNTTPTGANNLRIDQTSDLPFLTVTHAAAATTNGNFFAFM